MAPGNHEGLAGTMATINYLADPGAESGAPFADQYPEFGGSRLHLKTAMAAIRAYERPLAEQLIRGLMDIPGVTAYGITDPARFDERAPTIAFTLDGYTPRQVAERLSVEENEGMLRVRIAHYNTGAEADRLFALVSDLAEPVGQ